MLAVNDRMGARWWLQYEIVDGAVVMQGRWRQDEAEITDDAPCFHIIDEKEQVAIGPPRGQHMRIMPDLDKATRYPIAVWAEGPPENPETTVPPPPEFDVYARRVISELMGTADWSEYALPEDSAKNLLRQNIDLVDRGRSLGSNHDYVAREIVTRTEEKGAKVPRQEATGREEDEDETEE